MVADIAFHDFTGRHSHNPHAHILATTREIGSNSFSMKKTEWDKEEPCLHGGRHAKHANRALAQAHQTRIDHRSYKDRGIAKAPANETQQEWYIRQKQTSPRRNWMVNREIAALEQEQEHQHDQQLERLNAMMDIGRMLARDHIARNEQQSQNPQPNALETPRKETKPKPWSRPWKRDWERQHEEHGNGAPPGGNRSAKPPFSATRLQGATQA